MCKDNLGEKPALVAGASLLVDYVLTVAVSISAGVAAITSAVERAAGPPGERASRSSSCWPWPTCGACGSRGGLRRADLRVHRRLGALIVWGFTAFSLGDLGPLPVDGRATTSSPAAPRHAPASRCSS